MKDRLKLAPLPPLEFIRGFLQHRLPAGFVKIRHSGLLAPVNVNGALARAQALLDRTPSAGPRRAPTPRFRGRSMT